MKVIDAMHDCRLAFPRKAHFSGYVRLFLVYMAEVKLLPNFGAAVASSPLPAACSL